MLKKYINIFIFSIFFSNFTLLSNAAFCMQGDENHDKKHASLRFKLWRIAENINNPIVKSIGVVFVKEAMDYIWEDPRIKLLSPVLSTLLVSAAEHVIMKRSNFTKLDKKVAINTAKNLFIIEAFYCMGNALVVAGTLPIIFLQDDIKSPYRRPFKV
ncbi:MAG: hypothetical protein KBD36_00035 [Alphaproteobacteria bacterium]|nr:hypothetical protein [Alphaproteobacteria bacterium]MBP9776226.1 hypothetical protein [Alphaproteobacteria bacterium]